MHSTLDHEKLDVYQQSLQFIAWTVPLLDKLPRTASVRNQLDRASTSIPLNIAEGNGRLLRLIVVISLIMPVALRSSVPLAST